MPHPLLSSAWGRDALPGHTNFRGRMVYYESKRDTLTLGAGGWSDADIFVDYLRHPDTIQIDHHTYQILHPSLLPQTISINPFSQVVKATMAACVTKDVLFSGLSLFQCHPLAKAWGFVLQGKCLDNIGLDKAETTFSLATNTAILFLPLPTIWRLHMPLKRRLLLLGVFAIGLT